jgi:uncharacterized protein (TIGR03067 family)
MTATLALVVAGFLIPGDAPKDDPVKQELDKLQGAWVIVANTQEGKETPETLRASKRYTIKGDHYSVAFKGAEKPMLEFRIKLDPSSKPKTIDLIGIKTDAVFLRGIYELDGDTLRLCFPVGDADRPKELKSEAGSRSGIITYKRVKE